MNTWHIARKRQRYRLRTLLILVALGPPALAAPAIVCRMAAEMRRANEQKQRELVLRNLRGPYFVKSSDFASPQLTETAQ